MGVNETRMQEIISRDVLAVDQKVAGMLAQVTLYNSLDSTVNAETICFELDAIASTIREIFVSFYLPLHATATFTPRFYKTRPNDLVTFTQELIPAIAAIVTPAANAYYSYSLGDLAQGLQMRFVIHQSNNAPANTVDAWLICLMEV